MLLFLLLSCFVLNRTDERERKKRDGEKEKLKFCFAIHEQKEDMISTKEKNKNHKHCMSKKEVRNKQTNKEEKMM